MADKTRIYEINDSTAPDANPRLIEAPNAAQAVRFISKRYVCSVPSTKRVAELLGKEVKIEVAGETAE